MRRPRRVLWMMRPPERFRADYLILALAFLLGVLGGHLAAGAGSGSAAEELGGYLRAYSQAASAQQGTSPLAVLFAYFRMPVLLLVLSLISRGGWLIPPAMAGHGFLLAFSVRSIAAALGRKGLLIAFAAFGLRCCFVLPCCFFLAARRPDLTAPAPEIRRFLFSLFGCVAALLAGCAAEIAFGPRLFTWALTQIS